MTTTSSSDFEKKQDFGSWAKRVIESTYEDMERRRNEIPASTAMGVVDIKDEAIQLLETAIQDPEEGLGEIITDWRNIPNFFHEFIISVIQNKQKEDNNPLFSFGLLYERFNIGLENMKSQTPIDSSKDYLSIQTPFPILPATFDFVSEALAAGKVTTKWIEISYWRGYYNTIRTAADEENQRYSVRFLILLTNKLEEKQKKYEKILD